MPGTRRRGFPSVLLAVLSLAAPLSGQARPAARLPLQPADIEAIAQLTRLEDRRQFDSAAFAKHLNSRHPEVRRRAAQSVGRVVDKVRGFALLRQRAGDQDSAVAATVVWAVGQLKDTATVRWLDSVLVHPRTRSTVRTEAAIALGKVKSPAAGAALVRALRVVPTLASVGTRDIRAMAVEAQNRNATRREMLLSLGRIVPRPDLRVTHLAAIDRSPEIRWAATWAMVRSKDPGAVPLMMDMIGDTSALVRSWAVRALNRLQVDSAIALIGRGTVGIAGRPQIGMANYQTLACDTGCLRNSVLRALAGLVNDPDRAVRTETIRTLATWGDLPEARAAVIAALDAPDMWLAVTAAEGIGAMRRPELSGTLFRATAQGRSCALRVVAMQQLQAMAPDSGIKAAYGVAFDPVPHCRNTALQLIARSPAMRTDPRALQVAQALSADADPVIRLAALQAVYAAADTVAVPARRTARERLLANADPVIRAAALRSMTSWADTVDVATAVAAYRRALTDSVPVAAAAAGALVAAIERTRATGMSTFLTSYPTPPENATTRAAIESALGQTARTRWASVSPVPARSDADYRAIVERWVVPAWRGEANPTAAWDTPRGTITFELFAADAPLAMEEFIRLNSHGAIVGTTFTRVVADFVDQMATIGGASRLRDEVNRHGLTRANLAWATAGLDTGAPGYTLGHTPQPHNEGDFTSLGRVIRGMDAADRIQLGDRIIGARMLPGTGNP